MSSNLLGFFWIADDGKAGHEPGALIRMKKVSFAKAIAIEHGLARIKNKPVQSVQIRVLR